MDTVESQMLVMFKVKIIDYPIHVIACCRAILQLSQLVYTREYIGQATLLPQTEIACPGEFPSFISLHFPISLLTSENNSLIR